MLGTDPCLCPLVAKSQQRYLVAGAFTIDTFWARFSHSIKLSSRVGSVQDFRRTHPLRVLVGRGLLEGSQAVVFTCFVVAGKGY